MSNFSTCPVPSSTTRANPPTGAIATPNGIDARGSAIVRLMVKVAALITLIVALCLLLTHTIPLGATASVCGAVPTVTSASLARVTASNTDTVSASWFTTHSRALPVAGCCSAMFDDAAGVLAVLAR